MEIYLVGGALRDELMGQPVTDRDWVVVGATDSDMRNAGYLPVGKSFPVYLHPETSEEFALARQEKKIAPGHQGFAFDTDGVSLEEDLLRRDLTINAIARAADGQIIDPFNGKADLEAKLLRHVSPAFSEDPLRVLRVARFAARFHQLGFRVADETLSLMRDIAVSGELESLALERVVEETKKALLTSAPMVFFEVLEACGAHARLWPEIMLARIPTASRSQVAPAASLQWAAMLAEHPIEVISALGHRLPLPNVWTDHAHDTAILRQSWEHVETLSAEAIVDALYQLDSFRQGHRLETASGLLTRVTGIQNGAQIHDCWLQALELATSVSAAQVLTTQPDLKGAAIGTAIRAARVEKLKDALAR